MVSDKSLNASAEVKNVLQTHTWSLATSCESCQQRGEQLSTTESTGADVKAACYRSTTHATGWTLSDYIIY